MFVLLAAFITHDATPDQKRLDQLRGKSQGELSSLTLLYGSHSKRIGLILKKLPRVSTCMGEIPYIQPRCFSL
jgi:hypothetical protein